MRRVQGRVISASYSQLAMSLRSLTIILPLYYSTILTSKCATLSTDIPSYEAIHGRMALQYAYGLELPSSIRIHQGQPVSLLDIAGEDHLVG